MTVKRIELIEEVDNSRPYDQMYQGDTYTNYRIYRIVNGDGEDDQFFKIGLVHESYGGLDTVTDPQLVSAKTKTVLVYE